MSIKQMNAPKTLLILRHAKSDRPEGVRDFDRPLNERGLIDAPAMGCLIKDEGLTPQLILSSSAKRAHTTAQLAAEACGYKGDIELHLELYEAAVSTALALLRNIPDEVQTAMLVGHNPDLQLITQALTNKEIELPTAGLVLIKLDIEHWKNLETQSGKIKNQWRPKDL